MQFRPDQVLITIFSFKERGVEGRMADTWYIPEIASGIEIVYYRRCDKKVG